MFDSEPSPAFLTLLLALTACHNQLGHQIFLAMSCSSHLSNCISVNGSTAERQGSEQTNTHQPCCFHNDSDIGANPCAARLLARIRYRVRGSVDPVHPKFNAYYQSIASTKVFLEVYNDASKSTSVMQVCGLRWLSCCMPRF